MLEKAHEAPRNGDTDESGQDGEQRPEPWADGDLVFVPHDADESDENTSDGSEGERQGAAVLGVSGGGAETASAGDEDEKLEERREDLQQADSVPLAAAIEHKDEPRAFGGAGVDSSAAEAGKV